MPLEIWCEIVCSECARTDVGIFTRSILPRGYLEAEAKKRGWLTENEQAFCSSYCLEKSKEPK